MRYVTFCILTLFCLSVQAQGVDSLRLSQVQVALPTLHLWANLPADAAIEREQFSVSVGPHAAKVFAVEPFSKTGEGVGYVFLVDISKSLKSRQLVQIKRALQRWLEGMGVHDQAALITFGHEVKHSQAFTTDRFRLDNAIGLLAVSDMETSLYHGLLEAISLARSQGIGLPVRRAIILLSDGIDDSVKGVTLDDVLRQSDEYRVPIYSIGFATQPINDRKREGLSVLATLSRQSGGYFVQADPEAFDSAYAELYRLLSQAYRLRIDCSECVADGQLQHINLTWSDGARTLNDGMAVRLLPTRVAEPSRHDAASNPSADAGWSIFIFALGVLAFLVGLILLYRQRLAQPSSDDSQYVSDLVVEAVKPKDALVGRKLKLTVVAGVQKGRVYELNLVERATLGRAGSCDLSLDNDVEISTQHATLLFKQDKISVLDLNSTNGTFVNGVPIHNLYPLRNGDLLMLGRTELRIEF